MVSENRYWPCRSDLLESTNRILHCYNRGVDRQEIFPQIEFYAYFLSLVEKFHDKEKLAILAYCLMPNHFHFLFRQLSGHSMSEFMRRVCGEYARATNQARGRIGHLFQRRYGAKWVWRNSDVPLLVNYIHQNPQKAGLVQVPEEWSYSSCRDYLGLHSTGFLNPSEVLSQTAEKGDYRSFLAKYGDLESRLPARFWFKE